MLHLQKRITAVVAAWLLNGSVIAPDAFAMTANSNPLVTNDVVATVTAQKGTVFKRDFTDWTKQAWGDPEPAKVSDKLHEGMQVGTGNDSWAEISWPNVKTRAWANTVFAVAPSKRLVYLTGGEMLFRLDKHRKDKDQPYYIWTKVLQARIRGTTVLVQAKGAVTRFTVMEGTVDVFNRLDHSLVTVKPGVVYEVKGYDFNKSGALPQIHGAPSSGGPATTGGGSSDSGSYHPTPVSPPKSFDPAAIRDITYDPASCTPLFQDKYATTNMYVANKDALINHPLLSVGEPIDSLPLIQAEQQDLPGYNALLPIRLADATRLNKVLSKSTDIKAVPSVCDYFVGQSVGKVVHLPATATVDLPPKGMVLNPANVAASAATATTALNAHAPMFAPAPIKMMDVPGEAKSSNGIDKVPAATVFDEDYVPSPTVEFGTPATPTTSRMDAVVPNTCLTPGAAVGAAAGAFSTTSGMISPVSAGASNVMQIPTAGFTAGGAGFTAGTAGFTAGAAGTVMSPTGVLPTNLGAVTAGVSAARSVVTPVQTPLGGLLNNTTNNLNNTLNGLNFH